MNKNTYTSFSEPDIKSFEPEMKIGLLATVNEVGLPHLTLISTLRASTPTQVVWGQFTEGFSKKFIRRNPKTAFLIMTLDRELWRGRANLSHTAQQGKEFDMYNNTPMFRYNSYFGIHTVYYMDLLDHSGRQALPMSSIVIAALQTIVARTFGRSKGQKDVLTPWTQGLMNKIDNLKFLAYVGVNGYPVIIPVIQAQASGSEHVVFSVSAYRDELQAIPKNTTVAVFGMSLDMEDVLMRGTFQGIQRMGGFRCGVVGVNWVYNSMPPVPQQIYPALDLESVTHF
ncbi:MAG: pyridoxamine 5'-phosphate oxidase family protein [Chloroflexi bacterium]|nr:pyridoxamine 5'-phosphate oxidase family protein [Chloroflexota bacterium]